MINKKNNQKITGSFYTCNTIADYISSWAIENGNEKVLEPSFGDGRFIDAAMSRFRLLGQKTPCIYGVELQKEPFDALLERNPAVKGYLGDFMDFDSDVKVDAVIGNPPYVSLKNLTEPDRVKAVSLMKSYHLDMPTSGSLWMPFIVHSSEQVSFGGKIGFVLPYEITYVRYSFTLWEYLKKNFGKITIIRIHDDFFPEVDVETIIFLAENKGQTTDTIDYKVYQSTNDLISNTVLQESVIEIEEVTSMKKPFEVHLVKDDVWNIVKRLEKSNKLIPIVKECKFKIGYVSGNKKYFHPTNEDVEKYNISDESLIPCIINTRKINCEYSLGIDAVELGEVSKLFYPIANPTNEREYIQYGESINVNKGYKCRTRSPWFITPCLEIPDIILTVFGDVPRAMTNTGNYAVSNSLLSGILSDKSQAKKFICRWYNSLTLLMIEINIHSLGGGTLVLIPGEVDKLSLLAEYPENKVDSVYERLDYNMRINGVESTYELGDVLVLEEIFKLNKQEICDIRAAIKTLRSWRHPEERRG